MRKFIPVLALALTLPASPALSENWRQVSRVGGIQGYIDSDSVKRDGDKTRFRLEMRLPQSQSMRSSHLYDRIASMVEIDCRGKTYRILRIGAKLGDRSVFGSKSPDKSVRPVRPGTAADDEMRAVCSGDWASGG